MPALMERKELQGEDQTVAIVNGHDVSIATLRSVFNRIRDKKDWKAPWVAAVPAEAVELVLEAVTFFHSSRPEQIGIERITGRIILAGNGYGAW